MYFPLPPEPRFIREMMLDVIHHGEDFECVSRELSSYLWEHWQPLLSHMEMSVRSLTRALQMHREVLRRWGMGAVSWEELVDILSTTLNNPLHRSLIY